MDVRPARGFEEWGVDWGEVERSGEHRHYPEAPPIALRHRTVREGSRPGVWRLGSVASDIDSSFFQNWWARFVEPGTSSSIRNMPR